MRYAYAITSALLLGGATATLALQPGTAQTAQNEPAVMAATAPRPGAPMSFADMVAKLQPAVVNISTKQTLTVPQQANPFQGTPFAEMFGGQMGGGGPPVKREGGSLGSGFLISPDGYIVTNNHVIAPGAKGASVDSITVKLVDGKEYVAKVVGRDPSSDIAVLKVQGTNLPYVRFGDSTRSRVGDWVIAIGNPFGIGSSVTAGIVSAVHRVTGGGPYDRFIQTDASINQGNSGGPMFDMNGAVIGINSQIFSQSGGNIGIGFAIPSEDAKPIVDTLMKGGTVKRGYLGVGIQPVTDDIAAALGLPKDRGELISRVEPNEGAARAGLKPGDVVVRVNGKEVTPEQTLSRLVADVTPGSTARLDVIRDGRPVALNATVGTRPTEDQLQALAGGGDDDGFPDEDDSATPSSPAANSLGLNVVPLTPQIARSIGVDATVAGVVVASVDPSSDAAQKLKRGDVVTSVNRVPVRTAAAMAAEVARARAAGRDQVLLFVQRQKVGVFLPVKIGK
ncbi:protease [Sphingomonas sp. Leaf17]|uniref:Do family serine endopeptidase n=1 Tax=Sphingomonas sp. Leaf17 TaxID=1735683 RepID=UPI0006FBF88B|nr:Do family serine endopeptidase [Sphingomonas sp. Leaf17]KQM65566.1 protease [Sphingomonas sp. Leaf17]